MIKASLIPAREQSENVYNKLNCYTFIKVVNDDGEQTCNGSQNVIQQGLVAGNTAAPTIDVTNATSATIIVSAATNFINYNDISGDAEVKALAYMNEYIGKNKSYDTALADHAKKYQEQFGRVSLDLGENPDQETKDTEQRIKDFYTYANDPGLVANYFRFGRYLLISSSQPGTYLYDIPTEAGEEIELISENIASNVEAVKESAMKWQPSNIYYNAIGQQVPPNHKGIVITNGLKYVNK